ncbi:MAG: hypothetical protein KJ000_35045, partial [Pirellulaceae bacterium]|nr:hypothetical protein [Pirellulaceae bacterium]
LTVVTHELGHVLGHADLEPHEHPDHLMASILQPGTGRIEIAAGGHDSGLALHFGPAAGGRGPQCVASAERDSASETLFSPAAGGRGPVLLAAVDWALTDSLLDELRDSDRRVAALRDDEWDELLRGLRETNHEAVDQFFGQDVGAAGL